MKKFIAFALCALLLAPSASALDVGELPPASPKLLPVMMYHRIYNSNPRGDVYTITAADFEEDLKYFQREGYSSVTCGEVLAYLDGKGDLPEKPILLTFDDGHYNNVTNAAPLLEKYGFRGSIFIIGDFSERATGVNARNPRFSYINPEDMALLPSCLELQNHTYAMHVLGARRGIKRKRGESVADYRLALASDLLRLQGQVEHARGVRPCAFALPFGDRCELAPAVLDAVGIRLSLGSSYGVNILARGGRRHELYRLCRTPSKSAETLIEKYSGRISPGG